MEKNVLLVVIISLSMALSVSATDWPTLHYNNQRVGYSPDSAPITNNTIWNYTSGDNIYSATAIHNGVAYFGAYHDYKLYAMSIYNGSTLWTSPSLGGRIYSSPAIKYGLIFIGINTYNANIYAINETDGTIVWSVDARDGVLSSPVVDNGKVYISADDSGNNPRIFCLNAYTGAHVWNFTYSGGYTYGRSSPAIHNGVVFFGLQTKLWALNANTGAHIWNYTVGGLQWHSPTISNGRVIMKNNNAVIYSLNETTGSFIWSTDIGFGNTGCAAYEAIYNGKVFAIDRHTSGQEVKLFALDESTGTHIWNHSFVAYKPSSPSVAGGIVFVGVGLGDNYFYAFNESTGTILWKYYTNNEQSTTPSISDGVVYVGGMSDKLYAFAASFPTPTTTTTTTLTTTTTPYSGYTPDDPLWAGELFCEEGYVQFGDLCCPIGTVLMGDLCCPPNTYVSNGMCCPPGTVGIPSTRKCCPLDRAIGISECCPLGSVVRNEQCCVITGVGAQELSAIVDAVLKGQITVSYALNLLLQGGDECRICKPYEVHAYGVCVPLLVIIIPALLVIGIFAMALLPKK